MQARKKALLCTNGGFLCAMLKQSFTNEHCIYIPLNSVIHKIGGDGGKLYHIASFSDPCIWTEGVVE